MRISPTEVIADLCPVCCPNHPVSTGAYHATEVAKEDTAAWAGNVGYLATPVPGQVGNLEKELAMVAGDLKAPGVPKEPVEEVPASKEDVKTGSRSFKELPLIPLVR